MTELCPWCKSDKIETDEFKAKCLSCGATGPRWNLDKPYEPTVKELAMERWNTRADGWVSVSEQFPESDTIVLCSGIAENGKRGFLLCEYVYDDEADEHCFLGRRFYEITHWQIPTPPKEAK